MGYDLSSRVYSWVILRVVLSLSQHALLEAVGSICIMFVTRELARLPNRLLESRLLSRNLNGGQMSGLQTALMWLHARWTPLAMTLVVEGSLAYATGHLLACTWLTSTLLFDHYPWAAEWRLGMEKTVQDWLGVRIQRLHLA